jgi:hypothetical protein
MELILSFLGALYMINARASIIGPVWVPETSNLVIFKAIEF